ncbi:(d)CMP kinase [Amylibacter sp. SFDW26]|uniref:(d)CMP kinase n=1 Tax=Amylibacter sp. SFDW26 TaxID=2652722 RepID=UPI001262714A|nr:(d)CMP kinase [Amylibacter sp. SFDW26]KAB7613359.1 (d)CMP kinase [Amylibacter sp. SFDW26]
MSFTVAIDGPAAAGKGTISKAVAAHFGFHHLDTGLLYRAVGKKALNYSRTSYYPEIAEQLALELTAEDLQATDLRTAEVAQAASKIAVIPQVRTALVQFQKTFAKQEDGAVLDGRDIGTVICPDADVKLFVTASARVRADRRFKELSAKDPSVEFEQVYQDVMARDARDAERDVAPMVAADDAHLIDTSTLSIEEAIQAAIAVIDAKK